MGVQKTKFTYTLGTAAPLAITLPRIGFPAFAAGVAPWRDYGDAAARGWGDDAAAAAATAASGLAASGPATYGAGTCGSDSPTIEL